MKVYSLRYGCYGVIAPTRVDAAEAVNRLYQNFDEPPVKAKPSDFYQPMNRHDISPQDRWPDIVNAVEAGRFWIMA
jgi:hypothetical protein